MRFRMGWLVPPMAREMQTYWPVMAMHRASFQHRELTLSYLDAANDGQPLLALHAHWMEARTFTALAEALAPTWRVLALDQRGHGFSSHPGSYTRADYLADVDALLAHLAITAPLPILGNSLGGINAYHYALTRRERVRAIIVEDIGVVVADDPTLARSWAGMFPTRGALEAALGERMARGLADSIRETAAGWRMAFDPADTERSMIATHGDHWATWLASTCPALVIRGGVSRVSDGSQLAEMARRRPNTMHAEIPGAGHVVHADQPAPFVAAITPWLQRVAR